ncbi:MAG: hypothetical protein HQK76_07140 [Desulfobacterales bacterium]|nr:hypothetical protein [Desulfobacterales bacterium]
MRYFSFQTIMLSIVLPPVLYIISVQSMETWLKIIYAKDIQNIYIGDTKPLLDGLNQLKDAVNKNIKRCLKDKILIKWGVNVSVIVTTKKNIIIYPQSIDEEEGIFTKDPILIAQENYNLLNQGLNVQVDVNLEHNKPITNFILSFYISIFVLVLYYHYKSGIKEAQKEELKIQKEIERLLKQEEIYDLKLKEIYDEKKKISSEYKKIKQELENERMKTLKNEEGFIEEMDSLEKKLEEKLDLHDKQLEEIILLREKLELLEKEKSKNAKRQKKSVETLKKRFKAIYKSTLFTDRALEGFIDLDEDMKIKSEEIIHLLNDTPNLVSVKRKVVTKNKGKAVWEAIFGYSGRLYFRNTNDNKISILAIGDKNTQARDIEFIDNID